MSQIRRLLPSLNTLVAFEFAVRCGTFAKAARELGVTSPAVSRTIGRLEGHLRTPLFHRTPTGVVLTKDGSDLFAGVSRSFSEIERTVAELVDRRRSRQRPIVLSVSAAFATHWFMPRLSRFQARFPGQEIEFQLINGPLEGPLDGVDIAMRFNGGGDTETIVHPLMQEILLPVCAERYNGARSKADALLPAAARMISLSGSQFQWADLFAASKHGEPANEILLTDYSLVVQASLMGQGMAVGWFNVISSLLATGALVPAQSTVIATGRRCDLVMPRRAPSNVLPAVCEWMSAEYRDDLAAIRYRHPTLASEIGALAGWSTPM